MQRPDLRNVDPAIISYIEYLENKVGARQRTASSQSETVELAPDRAAEALSADHETTINIITVTKQGAAKRTYRHHYTRQHRGGMGVFGIDIDPPDAPVILTEAEESQSLLFFTSRARVIRQPMSILNSGEVMSKPVSIKGRFPLDPDETFVAVLPEQARGYISLVSESGRVRSLRHHLFGEHMRPMTELYKYNEYGPLAAACWTPGDTELFLITQQGIGIRFAEKAISPQGDQGIRLSAGDKVVGLAPVYPDSGVFILGADGRGTIRLMSGFAPNKTPGGSGKIAFKSGKVTGAVPVDVNDDIIVISRLGKVIRFPSDEVPSTEGVVQGVNCMGLRGDEAVALLKTGPIY